jgi:UDP-N-acetylmuramate--L-alanine ligase (EC 6.3.2.8)
MFREKIKNFHFVGIGGIGMSGIAQVLLQMGYRVSGSDLRENKNTELLRSMGARVFIGHREETWGMRRWCLFFGGFYGQPGG